MKKLFIVTISFFATIGAVSAATWNCDFEARLNGTQIGILIHHTELNGHGSLTCTNVDGSTYQTSVSAKITNWGGGIGYSKYENSTLRASNVPVSEIDDLFDEFDLRIWGETTFFKYTARTSVTAKNDDFEFDLMLSTKDTKGLNLSGFHFGSLTIVDMMDDEGAEATPSL